MHLKISSAKWRPFCLGLNVLSTRRACDGAATILETIKDTLTTPFVIGY